MDWTYVIMESVREMLTRVAGVLPKLIGVLIILVVGWLIAKLIEAVVVRGLKLVRLDTLSEKAGAANFLAKGGVKYTLAELIGVLIYWIVMLVVMVTALNTLQLTVAAELLNTVVTYVPNIIIAIFILVIGMFISTLLGATVRTAAGNAGIEQAKMLGHISQMVVIVFAIVISLQQLKIATGVIENVINITFATIGIAVAIAFGLGCKDLAGQFMEDLMEKMRKK